MLSLLRTQVQSLVGELRSPKPRGVTKTNKQTKTQKSGSEETKNQRFKEGLFLEEAKKVVGGKMQRMGKECSWLRQ